MNAATIGTVVPATHIYRGSFPEPANTCRRNEQRAAQKPDGQEDDVKRDKIERWLPAAALVATSAVLASDVYAEPGVQPVTVAALIVLVLSAWWVSPLHQGRHLDHAQAQARADHDDLIIYWKPGCRHCIQLLARLDLAARNQAIWVNVWQDDDAAAFVADHNDGNVLTPTVFTGAGQRVPRDLDTVRSHLTTGRGPNR